MKKLLVLLTFLLVSQHVLAQKRACVKAEFDLISEMAKSAGHKWTGTLKSCFADEDPSFTIYWSAPPAGGVMSATLRNEKMQFMVGGGMNLFCMQVVDGRWRDTGKECK